SRPLRAYGLVEIGIALYALAVPLLFSLIDHLYAVIWSSLHPGFYAFSMWRFLLSCAVLLVPTTLMGATLPILSAALVRSAAYTSASIARLYAFNLVGAILGTLFAGFFLLPQFGVRATIWTAASINFFIGLAAIYIDGRDARNRSNVFDEDATSPDEFEPETELTNKHAKGAAGQQMLNDSLAAEQGRVDDGEKFWLFCAVVSGFVTFSAQVAWTRLLTMVIGSSTYAFSIVVALFLLGLFGGAFVVSRQRLKKDLRRTVLQFELATAAFLVFSLWIINITPGLLLNIGQRFGTNTWLGLLMLQVLVACMLILIPAFLMGMIMPLVLVWAGDAAKKDSVRRIGRSYAFNTLGAIAGAWSTGFILIPKGGTRFTILFAASLSIIVAGLAYKPLGEAVDKDLRRSLSVGAMCGLILLTFIFAPALNTADLAAGVYDYLVRVLAKSLPPSNDEGKPYNPDEHKLLMFEEGPTATVSVREDAGVRSLAINGRTNASDHGDMPTQVMLGQLPLLVAPRTESGLVIGFASGVSAGAMLQSPLKSLECVELERAAVSASGFFEHVNNHPLEDSRVRLIVDDARTYLRVTPEHYDMIVSEPSHPWVPGVANLFTKEFFEIGSNRLRDDGVFVQWLQIYQLSTDSLRSVLATFHEVFPHVLVFRVGGVARGKDLILIGSRAPLNLDHLSERMSDARTAAELKRVEMNSPQDVQAWYVCDERQLGPAVAGAVINTDDNMHIETKVPREAFLPTMEENGAWVDKLSSQARESR
ncbi:MAG: fused MFS/spermidine synthase, partial [Pyrinomonadaceae bacterium]